MLVRSRVRARAGSTEGRPDLLLPQLPHRADRGTTSRNGGGV